MKKLLLAVLCLGLAGCASPTTQERVGKLHDKNENTTSVTIKGDVAQSKIVVRKVAEELKLIVREQGSSEVKEKDENFMLVTNNRLKSGGISAILGGVLGEFVPGGDYVGEKVSSPTNLGVFFKYNEKDGETLITISEEVSSLSFKKREEFAKKIKAKSLETSK